MKFGVFLPSFIQGEAPDRHARRLRDFARHAEELGFDSLWITDHIVTAHRFYSVSWLDSLMTLSHVAAITERVRLGTSILILPVRMPAILAKEIATLAYLSGNRYIYGIGTGWYGPEFEACGVHKRERGGRTDEVLDATMALFAGPDVDFAGRYYQLDGVTVEPHRRGGWVDRADHRAARAHRIRSGADSGRTAGGQRDQTLHHCAGKLRLDRGRGQP